MLCKNDPLTANPSDQQCQQAADVEVLMDMHCARPADRSPERWDRHRRPEWIRELGDALDDVARANWMCAQARLRRRWCIGRACKPLYREPGREILVDESCSNEFDPAAMDREEMGDDYDVRPGPGRRFGGTDSPDRPRETIRFSNRLLTMMLMPSAIAEVATNAG